MQMSASDAKLATTPPVHGSTSTATNGAVASLIRSTAQLVLAICMRLRMPSCMRAPPELQTATSGRSSPAASSARAPELLAHHAAHAAAHEAEIHHGEHARRAVDTRKAGDDGLVEPRLGLRLAHALGVGLEVGEAERVERARRWSRARGTSPRPRAGGCARERRCAGGTRSAGRPSGCRARRRSCAWAWHLRALPLGLHGVVVAAFDLDGDVHGRGGPVALAVVATEDQRHVVAAEAEAVAGGHVDVLEARLERHVVEVAVRIRSRSG